MQKKGMGATGLRWMKIEVSGDHTQPSIGKKKTIAYREKCLNTGRTCPFGKNKIVTSTDTMHTLRDRSARASSWESNASYDSRKYENDVL